MIIRHKSKTSQRKARVRQKIASKSSRLRLSVYRSNRIIYAQIIDDMLKKTLVAASGQNPDSVGFDLAQKAKKQKISQVVFDKGPYKFHGRVKALAETARKNGLQF